ncbi:hypothetical protein G9A89_006070 [Geosiphon pyriformis]|nr:hypothetical protein G9A89_006070 [Geosiphon pyriformis]
MFIINPITLALIIVVGLVSGQGNKITNLKPTDFVKGIAFDRVFILVLENTDFKDAYAVPYLKNLSTQGLFFTDYHGITHPSEPNYLAMISGQTFELDQYTRIDLNGTTIVGEF